MSKTTRLRLIGGAALFFNFWLIGRYNLQGVSVLLLTFGFAIGYELLVVKPAKSKKAPMEIDSAHKSSARSSLRGNAK